MTAWEDEDAMIGFVWSEAHRNAMRATRRLTTATKFGRTRGDDRLSDQRWADVYTQLEPTPDPDHPGTEGTSSSAPAQDRAPKTIAL